MTNKPIDLYYFSGTGNTLIAVRSVADVWKASGREVTLFRMEKCDPTRIDTSHILVLAFPVAMFSTYPFVWKFIGSLPDVNGVEVMAISTLGRFSGGLMGPLRNMLSKKGYKCLGATEVVMPSNFHTKPVSEETVRFKLEQGKKRAADFARQMLNGGGAWRGLPVLEGLLYTISRMDKLWASARRKLRVELDESKCIQCGHCYHLCPCDNIRMYEYPRFTDTCELCMRCVSYCPSDALKMGEFLPHRVVKISDLLLAGSNVQEPETGS